MTRVNSVSSPLSWPMSLFRCSTCGTASLLRIPEAMLPNRFEQVEELAREQVEQARRATLALLGGTAPPAISNAARK